MPKVSIVLPTYNGEKYLRESIESIINQTFIDWELIIVNDCSTDSTPQIAEEYALKDNRIRVIHNEVNQKLPNSLNIGFRQAQGDFLTWTSDDNLYLPEAIEKMNSYLDANGDIYMVCSNMNIIDLDGNFMRLYTTYDDEFMYYIDRLGACFMYKKEVIEGIGEYDPDMFLVEDADYFLRLLFKYKKIGFINDILYLYRTHTGSLSSTRTRDVQIKYLKMIGKYFDELIPYYKKNKTILYKLYYAAKENDIGVSDIGNKIFECAPELKKEKSLDLSKKTIIYGAGKYGDKAFKLLTDNVKFYADRDIEKVGTFKNGVEIISIDDMLNMHDEFNVLISVSVPYIYEVIDDLTRRGISNFSVFQSVVSSGV